MRHDPASAAIVVMLRSLKMYGLAQAAGECSYRLKTPQKCRLKFPQFG